MALNLKRGTEPDRFIAALLFATVGGPLAWILVGWFSTLIWPLVAIAVLAMPVWLLVFPFLLARGTDRAEPAVAMVGNVLSVSGFVLGVQLMKSTLETGAIRSSSDDRATMELLVITIAAGVFGAIVGVLVRWMKLRRAR